MAKPIVNERAVTSYREKYLNNLEIQIGATSFAPQTRDSVECKI